MNEAWEEDEGESEKRRSESRLERKRSSALVGPKSANHGNAIEEQQRTVSECAGAGVRRQESEGLSCSKRRRRCKAVRASGPMRGGSVPP